MGLSRGRRRAALVLEVAPLLLVGCVIPLSTTADGGAPASDGGKVATTSDGGASSSGGGSSGGVTGTPPAGTWANVTSNLANMASECGNLASVFSKPDEDLLIAGVAQKGLWASRDGGGSWTPLATNAASAVITNRPSSIAFDPSDSMRFWESGLYNGGGVYVTTDDGAQFTQVGTVSPGDLVSVDFTDPNRQTMLAGGHEMLNTLYRSTNGGSTWTNIGSNLPAGTNCTYPLVVDSQNFLVGCSGYGGGASGVYRSTDGGQVWAVATTSGGESHPLSASDGSIYWVSPNGNGLARSTDHGMTWADVVGPSVLGSASPIELPSGAIAEIGPLSGAGTQYVLVSTDHGATWQRKTAALPYSDSVGVVYSAAHKAFYIWRFTCDSGAANSVPANAIMSFSYDD
jgi:hypothetical protein